MRIGLKSDSDSRPVSMPTQVAIVLFLSSLGASWWIQDGAMSRVLLGIGVVSLIWIGYRLVNLVLGDLWNSYQISRLLRDNRPEEAIRRIDKFSRRPSPPLFHRREHEQQGPGSVPAVPLARSGCSSSRHFSPMGPEKAALFGIKRFE